MRPPLFFARSLCRVTYSFALLFPHKGSTGLRGGDMLGGKSLEEMVFVYYAAACSFTSSVDLKKSVSGGRRTS